MGYEEPANYDVAHHVLKAVKPLYQAKDALNFLERYVTLDDEGVSPFRMTQGQLDRIDQVLVLINASYTRLDQAHRKPSTP